MLLKEREGHGIQGLIRRREPRLRCWRLGNNDVLGTRVSRLGKVVELARQVGELDEYRVTVVTDRALRQMEVEVLNSGFDIGMMVDLRRGGGLGKVSMVYAGWWEKEGFLSFIALSYECDSGQIGALEPWYRHCSLRSIIDTKVADYFIFIRDRALKTASLPSRTLGRTVSMQSIKDRREDGVIIREGTREEIVWPRAVLGRIRQPISQLLRQRTETKIEVQMVSEMMEQLAGKLFPQLGVRSTEF